jgi:hypothetical protein
LIFSIRKNLLLEKDVLNLEKKFCFEMAMYPRADHFSRPTPEFDVFSKRLPEMTMDVKAETS